MRVPVRRAEGFVAVDLWPIAKIQARTLNDQGCGIWLECLAPGIVTLTIREHEHPTCARQRWTGHPDDAHAALGELIRWAS